MRRLLPVDAHRVVVQKAGSTGGTSTHRPARFVSSTAPRSTRLDTLHKCTDAMLVIAADAPGDAARPRKAGRPFHPRSPRCERQGLRHHLRPGQGRLDGGCHLCRGTTGRGTTRCAGSLTVKAVAAPEPDGGAKGTLRLLAKAAEDSDERYVLGIVLEPLTEANPDAQGDIHDAPTIKAAHLYMERFQERSGCSTSRWSPTRSSSSRATSPGRHGNRWSAGEGRHVDDGGPASMTTSSGSRVKSGAISGFSIGGWATRTPVDGADQSSGAAATATKAVPTMDSNVLKAEDRQEVYRLTDVVVREVSIVDRPANLRPFRSAKSEDSQGPELEPDGMGGFRLVRPACRPPLRATGRARSQGIGLTTLSWLRRSPRRSEVEKVGRKLAAKREQAIRQAIELLLSVIDDATKAVTGRRMRNKSIAAELGAERAELARLRAEHETKAQHVELVRSVSKARGNVQKSNALPYEERGDASSRLCGRAT